MSSKIRAITAVVAACTTATAFSALTASSASAHGSGDDPAHSPKVLNSSVIAPFGMAISGQDVWYTDGFVGTVNKISKGTDKVVTTGPQPEVAGIDVIRGGATYAFTSSNDDHSSTSLTIRSKGRPDVVADLSGYEKKANPDKRATYGIVSGGQELQTRRARCLLHEELPDPRDLQGTGRLPPVCRRLPRGRGVGRGRRRGQRHPPRRPSRARVDDRGSAATAGHPDGQAGRRHGGALLHGRSDSYNFEPVPTDVERGQHGKLWVSTLPGGPEDPSLGARGSVYTVNPWKHSAPRMATGFLGATDLALGQDGAVYVAELFGGQGHEAEARANLHGRHDRPTALDRDPGRIALRRHARGRHVRPGRTGGQRSRQHHPLPPLTRVTTAHDAGVGVHTHPPVATP